MGRASTSKRLGGWRCIRLNAVKIELKQSGGAQNTAQISSGRADFVRMRGRKAPRGAKEGVWQQGGRASCVRTKDALHLYQRPVLGTVVGTARQSAWVNEES